MRTKGADTLNAARRHVEQRVDQAWVLGAHRLRGLARRALRRPAETNGPPLDDPRIGIVTVNASTTRYLKLMLCTLVEQHDLDRVARVVVVDNGSRDGGREFLRAMAACVPRVDLVEHRCFVNHARGLRAGVRSLPADANLVLFCDPDVVFRDPDALRALTAAMVAHDAAIGGEARRVAPADPGRDPTANPDIQASFLAVRRDVLDRTDVRPPVHHGSPTLWLQGDVVRAGLGVVHFPSNHGGYVLHRGRTAVAATRAYAPARSYATAPSRDPHYMGVPDGAAIWSEVESRHEAWLGREAEPRLLDHLAARLGTVPP